MAGLTLRKGIWHITYYAEGGGRRRKSTGCEEADRVGAEIKKREFETEQKLGIADPYRKHRQTTIDKHIDDYTAWQKAKGFTDEHVHSTATRIKRYVQAAKIKSLDQISEHSLTVFVANIMSNRSVKKGTEPTKVGPRCRNQHRKSVKSFITWARRNRRIEHDPLLRLEMENERVDIRHARTALTDEQFLKLYETTKSRGKVLEGYDGATRAMLYLIAVNSGMRRKELASLTRGSFGLDYDNPTVTVEAAHAKNRKLDVIPLPKSLAPMIDQWLLGFKVGELLFPDLRIKKTWKMMERDLKAAGIPRQTASGEFLDFHALRHTYITRLGRAARQEKISPLEVQRLARHSDFKTTQGYLHTTRGQLRSAVDAVPALQPKK